MKSSIDREQVIEQIKRIPENRLPEVYSLLRPYTMGSETPKSRTKSIMQYAGAWSDMPEEVFTDFMHGITTRRRQAFAGRRFDGTSVN
jgi:hypothetical protein